MIAPTEISIVTFHHHEVSEKVNTCARLTNRLTNFYCGCVNKIYSSTSRTSRNLMRVSLAGGLSCVGGVISGDPRVQVVFGTTLVTVVFLGSFIGGVGNGLSTWLAWETDTEERIAKLEALVAAQSRHISSLQEKLSAFENLSYRNG
jgi:hypothetical protein